MHALEIVINTEAKKQARAVSMKLVVGLLDQPRARLAIPFVIGTFEQFLKMLELFDVSVRKT